MATAQRYPLSTADGQSIPLEVVKPLGVLRMPFTAASFNSQTLAETYLDKIFVVSASEDCYLSFASSASALVDNSVVPESLYIPAGLSIAFVSNSLHLSTIGVSTSGVLHVQIIDTWAGLVLEAQVSRR